MKNNRTVLIIILIFSVVIGGAAFLYNSLIDEYRQDSFVTLGQGNEQDISASDTADNSTSSAEEASYENETEVPSAYTEVEEEESVEEPLQAAPDFTVYDSSGNKVKLSDYLGKPVILNFWASWCGPCKSEMPGFDNLYKKYGDSVQFLMVNLTDGTQETKEDADSFIQGEGYSFPIYYDQDTDAAYTYGISSIPTTFLINEEGYIEAYAMGAISEEALENALPMIWEGTD